MTQLSPVKQKIKDTLSLQGDEFILVANGMYPIFRPTNPKASKIDTLVSCIKLWFRLYGREKTLAGIDRWVKAIQTRQINPKLPSDKSKLGQAYLEGIIKNTKDRFVGIASVVTLDKCGYCGGLLQSGVCPTCG